MIGNALRKIALPFSIVVFCVLIGLNAYVTWKNLKIIQRNAAQRVTASDVQSDIVAVQLDLENLDNGQRGYLLTGDSSYLAPYTAATQKLPADFAKLRSQLADRPARERALETDLEAIASGKISEAEETLRLRQKGYRHKAFLIVASNRGKELMDKAQSLIASLMATESLTVGQSQRDFSGSVAQSLQEAALANGILLLVTVITLLAFHYGSRRLERAYTQQAEALRATSAQLERLTSTLSSSVRSTLHDMEIQADHLLHAHGGFLPRQGQEGAEWLHNASCHVRRVIDDLLQPPAVEHAVEAGEEESGQRRDPQTVEFPETPELPRSHTA